MAAQSLEERIAALEEKDKKIEKLEYEIERLQAINAVHNLMCTSEFLHTCNKHQPIPEMWAHTDDDFMNIGIRGYWYGKDASNRSTENFNQLGEVPGMLPVHPLANPVIEVAGDCKTAKAAWIGVGFVAMNNLQTGEPEMTWEWDKYGVDFIKVDGVWKFWHIHVYRLFRCGYNDKWEEQFEKAQAAIQQLTYPEGLAPDGPPLDVHPYAPDLVPPYIPKPPVPYETWDDDTTYGLPPSMKGRKITV